MNYQDYIIEGNTPVGQCLAQMEKNLYKVLFIAPQGHLEGAVTDGDVRRYLLRGGDLSRPVREVASDHPLALSGFHEAAARELVEQQDLTCVPMLDSAGRIHALVFKNDTVHRETEPIDIPVIMMAGGLGTRLLPYTEILPKPLIPAGKITITEQIINRFKKFGCKQFSLVVNYKRNLIKSYFSEVDAGAEIEFVDEDVPLGTGGGLSFFRGRFSGPVFVTNCDSVIEADYEEILRLHRSTGSIITMVCARKKFDIPYGVVKTDSDGRVTDLLEKPSYELLTNTGFYVVSPEFIEMIPQNTFVPITETVEQCRSQGMRVSAYVIEEECFIDIGQLDDLRCVENKLK